MALESDPARKLRIRAERFADHYSQARLFYRSQTPIEQAHIASALVFELSKVELEHVRTRVLASLRNVDEDLASRVADGLAMPLPPAMKPAVTPIDMDPSPALSIVGKLKPTLAGRKVAILFDQGSSKADIDRVKADVEAAGGKAMLVAPKVGGIKVKGGTLEGGRPARGLTFGAVRRGGARSYPRVGRQARGGGRGGGFRARRFRSFEGHRLHA